MRFPRVFRILCSRRFDCATRGDAKVLKPFRAIRKFLFELLSGTKVGPSLGAYCQVCAEPAKGAEYGTLYSPSVEEGAAYRMNTYKLIELQRTVHLRLRLGLTLSIIVLRRPMLRRARV